MIAFKQEGGHLYGQVNGTNWIRLDNELIPLATTLTNGLMTREQVQALTDATSKQIKSVVVHNSELTITLNDDTTPVLNMPLNRQEIIPMVNADSLVLGRDVKALTARKGIWRRQTSIPFSLDVVRNFYDNPDTVPSGYARSSSSQLQSVTAYGTGESSTSNFFYCHRIELTETPNLQSDTKTLLRIKWRQNHADVKFGIVYKRGNVMHTTYDEVNTPDATIVEDKVYDITGITGSHIVVYCWASKWWSACIEHHILKPIEYHLRHNKGTWAEFEAIKNQIPDTGTFFITDINNGRGVMAIKVGRDWKDIIGNPITSRSYRTSI